MDWNSILPIGGLAAGIGFVGMFWRTAWNAINQLRSRVITSVCVDGPLVDAVSHYCWEHFKPTRFGARFYLGWYVFVRKVRRSQLVPLEDGSKSKLFWKGWWPVWVSSQDNEDDKNKVARASGASGRVSVTYFRGTLDPDTFMQDVCDEWNAVRSKYKYSEKDKKKRHFVRVITGTGDREITGNDDRPKASGGEGATDDVQWGASTHRLIGFNVDEIGQRPEKGKTSLDLLSLASDAESILEDIRMWLQSEDWYREGSGTVWFILRIPPLCQINPQISRAYQSHQPSLQAWAAIAHSCHSLADASRNCSWQCGEPSQLSGSPASSRTPESTGKTA